MYNIQKDVIPPSAFLLTILRAYYILVHIFYSDNI